MRLRIRQSPQDKADGSFPIDEAAMRRLATVVPLIPCSGDETGALVFAVVPGIGPLYLVLKILELCCPLVSEVSS